MFETYKLKAPSGRSQKSRLIRRRIRSRIEMEDIYMLLCLNCHFCSFNSEQPLLSERGREHVNESSLCPSASTTLSWIGVILTEPSLAAVPSDGERDRVSIVDGGYQYQCPMLSFGWRAIWLLSLMAHIWGRSMLNDGWQQVWFKQTVYNPYSITTVPFQCWLLILVVFFSIIPFDPWGS